MWKELPIEHKEEYKKMILAFASLTEMFAQKAENDDEDIILSPIINSKYQETVFQRVFNASAEDIGNTSYDAALCNKNPDGTITKYLIGIKTFGIYSGDQKVAQFKANHNEWSDIINQISRNSIDNEGKKLSKDEIDRINKDLYYELAVRIATLRNLRIESSESNIQGFSISIENDDVKAVYHVLMPSKKGEKPFIYVGETSYDKIDIDNLRVLGCTTVNSPTNFEFTDGNHRYRYTSADSQLLMNFNNKHIVADKWEVKYAEDAYAIFEDIANRVYSEKPKQESYSWLITNRKGEVEQFSGFNAFYGVGSKLSKDARSSRVQQIRDKYKDIIAPNALLMITKYTDEFLGKTASTAEEKQKKIVLRNQIIESLNFIGNEDFKEDVAKLLFRPLNEMYIPLPNSVAFHREHPDFFAPGAGNLIKKGNAWKLPLSKEQSKFNLIFEPSGDSIEAFITQDGGKAIESSEKQTILGEWILRKVFQLGEYEPLTAKRLKELGINGIRLSKEEGKSDIHLQFIWIDKNKFPSDYIK